MAELQSIARLLLPFNTSNRFELLRRNEINSANTEPRSKTSPENLAFPLYFLSSISFADHTNRNRSLCFTNDRFRIIGSTITRIVDEFRVSIRTIRFISSFFQNVSIIMLFVVRYALFSIRRFIFSFFAKSQFLAIAKFL